MSTLKPYFGREALLTHESSHDTLDETKFQNWLSNNAGLGIYAHGRIHQQVGSTIFVGDLIHKRGFLTTQDLLLMEEQALDSMGEPLSAPSRLGPLSALAILPKTETAYGEGSLIGYYRSGVVAFETQSVPRETRHDGEGVVIQKGWDTRQMVTHLLNTVSATGHYAVAVLPRDHLFRSVRGLHLLRSVVGSETFNSEQINTLSTEVDPLLAMDRPELLSGAAVGFWVFGNRYFATAGFGSVPDVAALPVGRGFVSWNQASAFTEDRTPRPAWEGLWLPPFPLTAVHAFSETRSVPDKTGFSALCSTEDGELFACHIDPDSTGDVIDGVEVPIEWSLETGQTAPSASASLIHVSDGSLEVFGSHDTRVRILIRTDQTGIWQQWRDVSLAPSKKPVGTRTLRNIALGKPPENCRVASWVQVRLEGIGFCEIRRIDLDISEETVKMGRDRTDVVESVEADYFLTNKSPSSERWQQA